MILEIKQKILSSPLIKNTLFLTVATISAQLISVAVSPILSRLYSPEDFGVLGRLVAFTSIFVGISTLKYNMAVVLSKSSKETKHLINWSEFFIIISSILAVPIYAIIYPTSDIYILISVFLIIFLNSNLYLFSSIYTRYKKFKKLSYAKVINRLSSAVFQILFGFILKNFFGLIIGLIVGLITFFGYCSRKVSTFSFIKIFKFNKYAFKEAQPILKKHYRFPLFTTPQVLLNTLSQNTPILMMDFFFGNSVIGFYWFAYRILQIPIVAISNSVRQTFFQKSSRIDSNKDLLSFLIKSTGVLIILGFPFLVIGFFTLPSLFEFIFGSEWVVAGEYAKWLLPWIFLLFINAPSISLITVINLQKSVLIFDACLLVMRIIAVYIGGTYYNPIITIKMFSLVGVVFNIFIISFIFLKVKNRID